MRFPKPKLSSDDAVKKALALFNERPEASHRALSTITVLQEAYGLPARELPLRIATGNCVGEVCGTLSGAIMALGFIVYKALEPRTAHKQRVVP